jgi:hypothetical protein
MHPDGCRLRCRVCLGLTEAAEPSHRVVASFDDKCKHVDSLRRCVIQATPNFTDDCTEWQGATFNVQNEPVPADCRLTGMTRQEAMLFLNDSIVVFIGDSTSRRANLQLTAFLQGSDFGDVSQEDSTYHSTIVSRIDDHELQSSTLVMSLWNPYVVDLVRAMDKQSPDWPTARFDSLGIPITHSEWYGKRKLVVLHYSSWDVKHVMMKLDDDPETQAHGYAEFVQNVTKVLTRLHTESDIEVGRDIVLFRLPIAQDCVFGTRHNMKEKFLCNYRRNLDPANDVIKKVSSMLHNAIVETNPQVGLIDVFSWTKAVGEPSRHHCAPSDDKGTHFATDIARLAYVQQVLFGAKAYSCGKPGWPSL